MRKKLFFLVATLGIIAIAGAGIASATHSWGNYHWARTANPFTLQLGDSVSGVWDDHLATASSDWSASSALDTSITTGNSKGKNCRAADGKVEVCNAGYGNTGWLGIAQIWVSGDHIAKGLVKMNDTYFDNAPYNSSEWRNVVMCQEIGHTLGLGHVDENFDNPDQNTCMDYSSNPTPNQHPNEHDYEILEAIYAHLDSTNTVAGPDDGSGDGGNGKGNGKGKPANAGANIDLSDPSAWGKAIREDANGNPSLFVRNLGNGQKVFTFVTWVE
ncbi:MAG: hypothetical protein Q8Q32_00260 [bacterium]|nr:hypothetical protein [bacterium]